MNEFLQPLIANLPEWLPQLLVACGETLQLTAASFLIAAIGGVLVALVRRSPSWVLRSLAIVYIEIARGMPALVILFLIYFALPTTLPALQFNSFTAACIGLAGR
jgi:His/Glu/Gln/Arg/opine family amino acid ABC transporter permease subunit